MQPGHINMQIDGRSHVQIINFFEDEKEENVIAIHLVKNMKQTLQRKT
jgi:hypothetical protein